MLMEGGPIVPSAGDRGTRERRELLFSLPASHYPFSYSSSTLKPQGSFENPNVTLPLSVNDLWNKDLAI